MAGNFRNPEAKAEYPDYYDSVLMNGVFENGVQFSIDGAAYVQYGYDSKMEIVGTKGVLQVGRSDANFVKCTTVDNGTSTPFISSWMVLFEDAYLAEDIAFAEAILNDTETSSNRLGRKAGSEYSRSGQSFYKGKMYSEIVNSRIISRQENRLAGGVEAGLFECRKA